VGVKNGRGTPGTWVFEAVTEQLNSHPSQANFVHMHGGQGRADMPGEVDVVKANDGQVIGYTSSERLGYPHGGDGHLVIAAKQRHFGVAFEHDRGGLGGLLIRQPGIREIAGAQPVVGQRLHVSLAALADAGVSLGVATDETDVPVAKFDQVLDSSICAANVVRDDSVIITRGGVRVYQHDRLRPAIQQGQMVVVDQGPTKGKPSTRLSMSRRGTSTGTLF
jgi:hypothetical protein